MAAAKSCACPVRLPKALLPTSRKCGTACGSSEPPPKRSALSTPRIKTVRQTVSLHEVYRLLTTDRLRQQADEVRSVYCPRCAVDKERHERGIDEYSCSTCKMKLGRDNFSAGYLKGSPHNSNTTRQCEHCKYQKCVVCKLHETSRLSVSENRQRLVAGLVEEQYICRACKYPPCQGCTKDSTPCSQRKAHCRKDASLDMCRVSKAFDALHVLR